ncbi:MAG: hypothetical protein ACR2K5_13125 [Pseudolabrys sp.]
MVERTYSPFAKLAMARAGKRLAAEFQDSDLAGHAATWEQEALAEITVQTPHLAPTLAQVSDPPGPPASETPNR